MYYKNKISAQVAFKKCLKKNRKEKKKNISQNTCFKIICTLSGLLNFTETYL